MKGNAAVVFALALCCCFVAVLAVPAPDFIHAFTQPDGKTFQARLWGDAFHNGLEDVEKHTLLQDAEGYWTYAVQLPTGELAPSSHRVGKVSKRELLTWPVSLRSMSAVRKAGLAPNRFAARRLDKRATTTPGQLVGTHNLLVFLVSFQNQDQAADSTLAYWQGLIFNQMTQDFKDMSGGRFSFNPAQETEGTPNDGIIGWVKLDMDHPGTNAADNNAYNAGLRVAASKLWKLCVANNWIDFKKYDTNNDNSLSYEELHIMFVWAGNEGSTGKVSPWVWGHKWNFYWRFSSINPSVAAADQPVPAWTEYSIFGEVQFVNTASRQLATKGIILHEFGHDLGFPDLYDGTYKSAGIGSWSLMAGGSWGRAPGAKPGDNPANIDAFMASSFGWIDPLEVKGTSDVVLAAADLNSATYTLPANTYFTAYVLKNTDGFIWRNSGEQKGEYFLVEYRRQKGRDISLPGCGVIVWHIDQTQKGNRVASRKLIDVVEADGNKVMDVNSNSRGRPEDLLNGNGNKGLTAAALKGEVYGSGVDTLLRDSVNFKIELRSAIDCNADTVTVSFVFDESRPSTDDTGLTAQSPARLNALDQQAPVTTKKRDDTTGETLPAHAAPTNPSNPDCCATYATPGCADQAVVDCVCFEMPQCCSSQWTQECTAKALDEKCLSCPLTLPASNADCCVGHATPGCNSFPVMMEVCSKKASCCLTAWDKSCVAIATRADDICGVSAKVQATTSTEDCCTVHATPGCKDQATVAAICGQFDECCAPGNSWSDKCVKVAKIGGFCQLTATDMAVNSQSCCQEGDAPGCSDANVVQSVCTQDPYCCLGPWDLNCITLAGPTACSSSSIGFHNDGPCGEAVRGLGGCNDPEIEALVCEKNFFCCSGEWDESCVKLLGELEDDGTLTYKTDDLSSFPGSNVTTSTDGVSADIPLPGDQKAGTKAIQLPKVDLPAGQKYTFTLDANDIPAGSQLKIWIGNDASNPNNKKFAIPPASPAIFTAPGTVTVTSDKPGQFWVLTETELLKQVPQKRSVMAGTPKIAVKQALTAAGNCATTTTTTTTTTPTVTAATVARGTSINIVFSGLLK